MNDDSEAVENLLLIQFVNTGEVNSRMMTILQPRNSSTTFVLAVISYIRCISVGAGSHLKFLSSIVRAPSASAYMDPEPLTVGALCLRTSLLLDFLDGHPELLLGLLPERLHILLLGDEGDLCHFLAVLFDLFRPAKILGRAIVAFGPPRHVVQVA